MAAHTSGVGSRQTVRGRDRHGPARSAGGASEAGRRGPVRKKVARSPAASKVPSAQPRRKSNGNGGATPRVRRGREQPPDERLQEQPTPESGSIAWTVREGEVGIRVRMYRVGFGEFFLLSFMKPDGSLAHTVIDCGVFKGTSQTGDIGSIDAAVANMLEVTRRNVALIVMTHRHADHIAGFARCADDFKSMTVQGVWMPVWESEYDSTALKYQAELTRTALGLQQHFASRGASATAEEITARKFVENALGVTSGARGSNADALNLLKHELNGAKVDYYKGGDTADVPQSLQDAGVSAQILGPPPVSDLALMKLMDVQKGVGQYLAEQEDADESQRSAPFEQKWETTNPFSTHDSREGLCPRALLDWVEPKNPWRSVDSQQARKGLPVLQEALRRSLPMASLVAAKQLNSFLNNQSLVVLFTFKGRKLLFVGDSQAGCWEYWLYGTHTPDKVGSGAIAHRAREILTSIDFYKVGHHGSGNATPKVAVEAMESRGQKFAAMCSTEAGVYGTEDPDDPTKGTAVPRIPLLQRLADASALVRSDQIPISVDGKAVDAQVSTELPASVTGRRFEKGPLWIDCYL